MAALVQYDEHFYDFTARAARSAAEEMVPYVLELTGARSVVDVGCGLGTWLSVFAEHGADDVLGLDGGHVEPSSLHIAPERFVGHDLTRPLPVDRTFDLAVSLETAEHLPAECADAFVASLTRLAPVVLFSAAIPMQGGVGHVNEQWPDYWATRFASHGYVPVDALRPRFWGNRRVAMWYAQNCLLYARDDVLARTPALDAARAETRDGQLDLVHPSLFLVYRVPHDGPVARFELDPDAPRPEPLPSPSATAAPDPAAPLGLRELVRQLPGAASRAVAARRRRR